jgi:hypothetical protein
MRDPEDAMNWTLVIAMGLIVIALGAGVVFAIHHLVSEAADKRACRASGNRVIEVKDSSNWYCAAATPERP